MTAVKEPESSKPPPPDPLSPWEPATPRWLKRIHHQEKTCREEQQFSQLSAPGPPPSSPAPVLQLVNPVQSGFRCVWVSQACVPDEESGFEPKEELIEKHGMKWNSGKWSIGAEQRREAETVGR